MEDKIVFNLKKIVSAPIDGHDLKGCDLKICIYVMKKKLLFAFTVD